jgi:hypothetical protein
VPDTPDEDDDDDRPLDLVPPEDDEMLTPVASLGLCVTVPL